MSEIKIFIGNCHCGNIQYEFKTALKISEFAIRRCDCSYCTKSGTRYVSDPNGELSINIGDESQTSTYEFGTKTAQFKVCAICGSIPLATSEIDGNLFGIVNINTLEEAEHFSRHAKVMSYDEETVDERLSRRKKNWIGRVTYG